MEMDNDPEMKKDEEMPHYRTLMMDRMMAMEQKGFTGEYELSEDHLKDLKTGTLYHPDDVTIVEMFRHEGISNPDDMSVVYCIQTSDGKKGMIIDAYGVYGDNNFGEFIRRVKHLPTEHL